MQQAGIDTQSLGEQPVSPVETVRAFVVAQRPGAEHFEDCQVSGIADLLQVRGTQTPLHVDQPPAQRMGAALQVWSERVHTGGGEQHGVTGRWQQRRADDPAMGALFEVLDERTDQLFCLHGLTPSRHSGEAPENGTVQSSGQGQGHHGTTDGPFPVAGWRGKSGGGNRRAGRSRGRDGAWAGDVHADDHNAVLPTEAFEFSAGTSHANVP